MKKLLLLFLALTAVFLPLAAQDWAPFKMGRTPYFQAGDSIYSLRLIGVEVVGSDSVFEFNPIVVENGGWGQYIRHWDNIFGWKMKKTAVGSFQFEFSDSTSAEINPHAAVGVPHIFLQQQNLDITLLSRGIGVLNNQSDSLLTYLLSNGDTITLSRSNGLLSARSFLSYKQPNSNQSKWKLSRLPETGFGEATCSFLKIYDFQPGDKFLFRSTENLFGYNPCSQMDRTVEILSKYVSPFGDTLIYFCKAQSLVNKFNHLCDMGMPYGTLGQTLTPIYNVNWVILKNEHEQLESMSYEYSPSFPSYMANVNFGSGIHPSVNRMSVGFLHLVHDSFNASFNTFSFGGATFVEGLGQTEIYSNPESSNINTREKLIAYIKGTETHGNWQPLVLSSDEEMPENPVQAFPNPFTYELTIKLPEQTTADITIYNLQGQKIQALQTNGEANLQLPELPAGLYLLHVQQGERSYTVKVQKQ
ncbi:MAG: T9SS type A sorting domain-containing protein [Chitinophagaceae bacterium]|nr:MAG: T9SS type A sorting domain-containing protein [Chitinophagaceae bacterium]